MSTWKELYLRNPMEFSKTNKPGEVHLHVNQFGYVSSLYHKNLRLIGHMSYKNLEGNYHLMQMEFKDNSV